MKVLMLTWEYPPKNVGGISAHVYNLSQSLSALGHEIHIITCIEGDSPSYEEDSKVFVHRVFPLDLQTNDFAKWVMHLNFSIIEEANHLIDTLGNFDLIHAHDWLCCYSAKVIKSSYKIPMVSTIHATEFGRNSGIKTELQSYISSVEWLLAYESWKIVVCSNFMRQELNKIFNIPVEKIWVIPNGVDYSSYEFSFDWLSFRRNYAKDSEKILLFIGRHVFEKGLLDLVTAAKELNLRGFNMDTLKFIIAGNGPLTPEIKGLVRDSGLDSHFYFTGYVDSETKLKLYKVSNIALFPSTYEPFGIVALEAMAAGCPVIVSNTGGLNELIDHKVTGLKSYAGCPNSLADNILQLLFEDGLSETLKYNALKMVKEKYSWDKVASLTSEMYDMVLTENNSIY